jgi:hypothetical protein
MKSIQQSIVIKGSVDDVFSALADPTIQLKFVLMTTSFRGIFFTRATGNWTKKIGC